MDTFTNELFALAWARLLANFPQLPERLQLELEPYKALVQSALEQGCSLAGLAAAINEITVRHVRARLLPMELPVVAEH